MAPPEGLLRRSRSHFGGATICDCSKTAPAPLFFTEKWLFQENVWQDSSGGAGAGAGEEPFQTGPYLKEMQQRCSNYITITTYMWPDVINIYSHEYMGLFSSQHLIHDMTSL